VGRYVAFLRAVNVNRRRVTMDRLRGEFEALGFEDVSTFINSGNVVFSAAAKPADLEPEIEARLGPALGFEVPAFVRTAAQVGKVARLEPFADARDGDTHNVAFLRRRPTAAARTATEALSNDTDRLAVHGRELHWLIRGRMMDSTVSANVLQRALGGEPGTTRNITMLRKLAAKLDAGS
jgi:uncharacterized protein (DUF1697 family)